MGCGCADRMRKYVLPYFNYTFDSENQIWTNPDFPSPTLRVIKNEEVALYHTRLTVKLVAAMGITKFLEWAKSIDWDTSEAEVEQQQLMISVFKKEGIVDKDE